MKTREFLDLTARRSFLLAITAFGIAAWQGPSVNLALFYLHRQDRWLLLAAVLMLLICVWRPPAQTRPFAGGWRIAMAIGALMAVAAYAGHYLILSGYDLSRDEQMATFDAAVFAQGQIVAPVTGIWRSNAAALNTMFMYPTTATDGWISSYLPLNAALRALFSLVGDAALTGPAMLMLGAVALWGCARRIWPDDSQAAVVALLLYLGSGQVLLNGMTAYAMPAHLALNLSWLWLFLRRTPWTDVAALAIGFVAVGLHQPIMHPMFAAPILFLAVLERDWRRATFFFLGYAAIGAFWAWWPSAMWSLVEADAAVSKSEGVGYFNRLIATVLSGDGLRIANMISNILRFFAWQHLLLLPLFALGVGIARKDRLAGALMGGIMLTAVAMVAILPYQGHGFGYRYFHGLIGNFVLLAGYGWTTLRDAQPVWRDLLQRTTAAALLVILPLQAWMAHAFYAPAAHASERLAASEADYVVVGAEDAPFAVDLVINPPALDRRPVRLVRELMTPELVRAICAPAPRVAIAGADILSPIAAYYGVAIPDADRANRQLREELHRAGCRIVSVG